MAGKSIKRNYIYQSGFQILNLLVPVITTPYVSRRLQAEGIGAFSYTYSIVCYLVIFSNLGIHAYASRKMSVMQESLDRQAEFFWQIIGTKLINMIFPSIAYGCVILFHRRFAGLFISEIFFFAGGFFNISWYFTGMENFERTVKNSVAVKLLSVVLLFAFVKDEGDLHIYALIMGGTVCFGDLLLWKYLPPIIKMGKPDFRNYKKTLAGGIKMLMPELAASIFTYGDKIMLGFLLISTAENGYYEQSQKIITLSQGLINSIATVMLPRIANLYSRNDKKMVSYYMNRTIHFLLILGLPIAFGISGIAKVFVPWFFGNGFESVETLLYILSPVVFIHGIYYILGYQFLFGTNQETRFTGYILTGAFLNTVLNFIMIPGYGAAGASAASLISEIVLSVILLVNARNIIHLREMAANSIRPFLASLIMYAVLIYIRHRLTVSFASVFFLIGTGIAIYGVLLLIFGDAFVISEIRQLILNLKQKYLNKEEK